MAKQANGLFSPSLSISSVKFYFSPRLNILSVLKAAAYRIKSPKRLVGERG